MNVKKIRPRTAFSCLFIIVNVLNDIVSYLLLSSDIRSEGSIAIVKIFDFDFLMISHSTSLPESKNVF